MGATVITNATRPYKDSQRGIGHFTNEPRVHVLWDGVANRKQNSTMANGVVWVPLTALMRQGNSLGYAFQVQNSGATGIKIEGSMSSAALALYMTDDASGNAIVASENTNFQTIVAAALTGIVTQTVTFYTLARLTFAVGQPAAVVITTM